MANTKQSYAERVISQTVSQVYERFRGTIDVSVWTDNVIAELSAVLDTKAVFEDIVWSAVNSEVLKQRRHRHIERFKDSGDLFPDALLDMAFNFQDEDGNPYSIKVRDAKIDHHIQFEKQQLDQIQKAKRKYALWQQRREALYSVMEQNPYLTTEQALELLAETT